MAKETMITIAIVPVSELVSQTVISLFDTIHASKEVIFQKENFQIFSRFLERTSIILRELPLQNIYNPESLKNALEILHREVKVANKLAMDCTKRNKVYLLVNCRKIAKQLDRSTKEISRALSLIPLALLDVSSAIKDQLSNLCENMLDTEFRAAVVEEEILAKIELGIQERNGARSYANDLLFLIAKTLGISTEQGQLKKEFEDFRCEIEDVNLRKELAESLQMEQIIALLEKADATSSAEEKEKKYLEKRNSMGGQPLAPLARFRCPITQNIMVDPVETSSGQTFERSAIEKCFAEGNTLCPITMLPLDTSVLRPNKTLRQSIEEWKERNTIITIASMKPKLLSSEEEEVLQTLDKLQSLCMERELHREWVIMEDYVPVLIGLLSEKNQEIRKHALVILSMLAADSEANKEKITKVDNALESIVRSLARKVGESELALHLLLELSRSSAARDCMGNVQGCILLSVTILSSDDDHAARDAEELLENLAFLNQNVKQMARANYFKPMLQLLSSGGEEVRMVMAETLAEIELTDHNKLSIVKDGALPPLVQMLSHGDIDMKKVAVRALLNLSNLPENGQQMIKEGAVGPLFELLYRHSLAEPKLREQVAATIMHLSESTSTQEVNHEQVSLLESDEDILKLFSLVSLTGPDIQPSILKTFHALCQSPSGSDVRMKLRQLSVVQVLVQLCEAATHRVRANAVNLFYCLTKDGDHSTFQEHVGQRCIETLLRIIETSNDVEEIASALGIVSNLPKNLEMTQCLVDAGAVPKICACLTDENIDASYRRQVVENAVGALYHFTVPTNQEWQKTVAEAGIIPVLVHLLTSGTSLTRQKAAIALKQLSESSNVLSRPVRKNGILQCCFSKPEIGCPAHLGICEVESSFCLLEAKALDPLVRMVGETDLGACEASLDALLTLIDEDKPQNGSRVLDNANAIAPIIRLLSSNSVVLQRKCLKTLERIFQLDELKKKYGSSAQMPLVDIAQQKASDIRDIKSLAAKILAQLGLLGNQSSFF
uniref:RING-type E3 ubiquitin transferase n=1 Tax=Ziziphus jujuba TaxID=326968 RepID=A0A6P3ZXK7_ZIZJJ